MEQSELVSIIMPNYNGQPYISKSIESVLSQSYKNFEFIIIDDASTDDSWNTIEGYDDCRIRAERLPKNEHICYALNYGLKIAKGNYIARIDDDDCWEPEKLQKQIDFLRTHPDYGACFTWVTIVDELDNELTEKETDRAKLFHVRNRSQTEWIRHFFFNGSCLCHPSAVMTRNAIEEVGEYDYGLVQIQDFDMWVRIAKRFPIHIIEEPLTRYRWTSSGDNLSAPSASVNNRSSYEFYSVISHYFDDISDELFLKAFSKDMIRKDAQSHEEILCEQALLLLRPLFCGYAQKLGGMDRLKKLLGNEKTRKLLREKYGVTQKNFYELSASPVFYEHVSSITVDDFGSKDLLKALIKKIIKPIPGLLKLLQKIKSLVSDLKQ